MNNTKTKPERKHRYQDFLTEFNSSIQLQRHNENLEKEKKYLHIETYKYLLAKAEESGSKKKVSISQVAKICHSHRKTVSKNIRGFQGEQTSSNSIYISLENTYSSVGNTKNNKKELVCSYDNPKELVTGNALQAQNIPSAQVGSHTEQTGRGRQGEHTGVSEEENAKGYAMFREIVFKNSPHLKAKFDKGDK